MIENHQLQEMENLFLALSDQTRLKMLNLMRDGEVCVCWFSEVLGESQPKISRHLAYLRSAGIVSARRDGKWMYYKIDFPELESAAKMLDNTLEWLAEQEEMRRDYEKLAAVCCVIEPVAIAPHNVSADTNMNYQRREELDTFLL